MYAPISESGLVIQPSFGSSWIKNTSSLSFSSCSLLHVLTICNVQCKLSLIRAIYRTMKVIVVYYVKVWVAGFSGFLCCCCSRIPNTSEGSSRIAFILPCPFRCFPCCACWYNCAYQSVKIWFWCFTSKGKQVRNHPSLHVLEFLYICVICYIGKLILLPS